MAARWKLARPLSIGTVHAGDWASSVPDLLVAEGRLSVALDEPVENAKAEFKAAVAAAYQDDDWLRERPSMSVGGADIPPPVDCRLTRSGRADEASTARRECSAATGRVGCAVRQRPSAARHGKIPTSQYGPGEGSTRPAFAGNVSPIGMFFRVYREFGFRAAGHW